MKLTEALYPDANPINVPSGTKTYALNTVMSEEGNALVNEPSTYKAFDFSEYGTIIGTIPLPKGCVIFFVNDEYDAIFYYNEDTNETTIKHKLYKFPKTDGKSILNFSKDRPITGVYSYNRNNHILITMSEGNSEDANETRIFNINLCDIYNLSPNEQIEYVDSYIIDDSDKFKTLSNDILLIPDLTYPAINIKTMPNGSLLAGTYQFAIAYKLAEGSYSNYSLLSEPYYASATYSEDIKIGQATSRSFKIELSNLDLRFKQFKLAIVYTNDTESKVYESSDKNINLTTDSIYLYSIDGYKEITLEDISLSNISYIKDESHTNFNSQLIRANVSTSDINKILDDYIKDNSDLISTTNVRMEVVSYDINDFISEASGESFNNFKSFKDKDLSNCRVFKNEETYIFYIGFFDKKGNYINSYPIYINETNSYLYKINNYLSDVKQGFTFNTVNINVKPLLDKLKLNNWFKENITSYIILRATANESNSSWICSPLVIRDTCINDVVSQSYRGVFKSVEKHRVYPIEYLVTNTLFPSSIIYPSYRLNCRMTGRYAINRCNVARIETDDNNNLNTTKEYELGDEVQSDDSYQMRCSDLTPSISINPIHIPNNNSAVSNLAGDSYYRIGGNIESCYDCRKNKYSSSDLNTDKTFDINSDKFPILYLDNDEAIAEIDNDDGDKVNSRQCIRNKIVVPGNFAAYYNDDIIQEQPLEMQLLADWATLTENNRCVVDCYRRDKNNNSWYSNVDPYSQTVIPCSPILDLNNTQINLTGDTFINMITIRCVSPGLYYLNDSSIRDSIKSCHRLIISYFTLSRFNLQVLHSGNGINSKVYKIFERNELNISDIDKTYLELAGDLIFSNPYRYDKLVENAAKYRNNTAWEENRTEVDNLADKEYIHDNFFHTDDGSAYEKGMNSIGFNDVTLEKDLGNDINNFPTRIIRSDVNPNESEDIGWRRYKANNYKDISIEKGAIKSLKSDSDTLYIQCEHSLFIASVKDTLSGGGTETTYLGSSDLFQREPKEILFSTTGKIGCDNKFSNTITQIGYLVCDIKQCELYLVNSDKSITRLSDAYIKHWFKYQLNKSNLGTNYFSNPYTNNGIFFTFDEDYNRILFTTKILKDNNIDTQKSFTLSYDITSKTWKSFHSYIPDYSFINRNGIRFIKDNKFYGFSLVYRGKYFDKVYPSVIQIVYNEVPDIRKLLKVINWTTTFIVNDRETLIEKPYNKTYDYIMIQTDTQCTGLISVEYAKEWFDSNCIMYKGNRYYLNNIEDYVNDDKSFIQPAFNKFNFLTKEEFDILATLKDNCIKDWYDIGKLQSDHFIISLIYMNEPLIKDNIELKTKLYMNDLNVEVVKDNRITQQSETTSRE